MPIQYYIQDTNEAILVEDKPFASGGEGGLHEILEPARLMTYVAKIFHANKRDKEKEKKIKYLIANPPSFEYSPEHQPIIWVEKALYDEKGEFIGFIMPRAHGEKLEILCSPKLPKSLGGEWNRLRFGHDEAMRLRMKVCYNLAAAIHQIHATGRYVLVDLKPDNILIRSNGVVSIVDTDSIEVIENGETLFPATVVTPEYTPAEYYNGVKPGKVLIEDTWDRFSLAVIYYRLLMGVHPFAASSAAPYDVLTSLGDKIKEGLFVHTKTPKSKFLVIPPPHKKFKTLDDTLRQCFMKTLDLGYEDIHQRTTAEEWGTAFLNNPLLLVDRPLPSKALKVTGLEHKNWYDMALSQALVDLNLTPPKRQLAVIDKDGGGGPMMPSSFWKQIKDTYKKAGSATWVVAKFIGIVLAVITVFILVVGTFTQGYEVTHALKFLLEYLISIPIYLLPVLPFLLLIPFVTGIIRLSSQRASNLGSVLSSTFALTTAQKQRSLEDRQYSLFSKRVKLKQRLQEIKAELDILKQVKQKKEQEFNRKNNQAINTTNKDIQTQITQERLGIAEQDQLAQSLMKEEAQKVRECRLKLQELLDKVPYKVIPGKTPQQKIGSLGNFNLDLGFSPEEVIQITKELQALEDVTQQEIDDIKASYDANHQALIEKGGQFKIKIDDITKSATSDMRQKINIDNTLLNKSYRKLLKTRNELTLELYDEEMKLQDLNEHIRVVRDELNKYR
ncbi:MAG: serine/threonine protein kinase [Aureispira sp.]|nr:serine/threonine protein kinase [Aureispira sp.]